MTTDDGTWRYEWPAGARFLPEIADLVEVSGKRVIDLGCGRGRLGTWALAAGAAEVLFADRSAEALAAIDPGPGVRHLVHVWGEMLPPCEVLLGGDILYLPPLFPALLDSIASALRPASVAWLVDPRTRLEPELPIMAAERGLAWAAERRLAGYTVVRVTPMACGTAVV